MVKKIVFTVLILSIIFFLFAGVNENKTEAPTIQSEQSNNKQYVCPEEEFGLDCEIISFLKKEIGWINDKRAESFCAYILIGGRENETYLKTACGSFYVSRKQIVCPDDESSNQCFSYKNCGNCQTEDIEPRLVQDSGISIPVKLIKSDNGYSLEKPGDGSTYIPTMRKIFPADIIDKISANQDSPFSLVVPMAEKHFKVKSFFSVKRETENECSRDEDCIVLPEDMLKSDCPREGKCMNKKCMVGCYDFIDHEILPIRK